MTTDGVSAEDIKRAAKFSLRHYVTFSYYALSPEIAAANEGMCYFFVCSAFVMYARGIWCLVTAGHVLDGIFEDQEEGIELKDFRLWDGWSTDARHREPIPFDFFGSPSRRIDEGGLDYGIIYLRPLYVLNLQANGVVPVGEESYEKDWPETFHGYAMIGAPWKTVELRRIGERSTQITQSSCVLLLAEEHNPPAQLVKSIPRFYGRILEPEDSLLWRGIGRDIRGMSGGPIIGVRRSGAELRYWLVAVQSEWLESRRVIAACYFQGFARLVAQRMDELRAGITGAADSA